MFLHGSDMLLICIGILRGLGGIILPRVIPKPVRILIPDQTSVRLMNKFRFHRVTHKPFYLD